LRVSLGIHDVLPRPLARDRQRTHDVAAVVAGPYVPGPAGGIDIFAPAEGVAGFSDRS
jgi:hypothetical protein